MKLYVGNLSYDVTEEDLLELFSKYGNVESAKLITDKYDNRSKGFGFIEYSDRAAGEEAIQELDDTEHRGRTIKVNEARPKEDNRGGRGGGNRRGGNGGGNRRRGGNHGGNNGNSGNGGNGGNFRDRW